MFSMLLRNFNKWLLALSWQSVCLSVSLSVCLSVCLSARISIGKEQLENLYLSIFRKTARENSNYTKIWQKERVFRMKTCVYIYDNISLNSSQYG